MTSTHAQNWLRGVSAIFRRLAWSVRKGWLFSHNIISILPWFCYFLSCRYKRNTSLDEIIFILLLSLRSRRLFHLFTSRKRKTYCNGNERWWVRLPFQRWEWFFFASLFTYQPTKIWGLSAFCVAECFICFAFLKWTQISMWQLVKKFRVRSCHSAKAFFR